MCKFLHIDKRASWMQTSGPVVWRDHPEISALRSGVAQQHGVQIFEEVVCDDDAGTRIDLPVCDLSASVVWSGAAAKRAVKRTSGASRNFKPTTGAAGLKLSLYSTVRVSP